MASASAAVMTHRRFMTFPPLIDGPAVSDWLLAGWSVRILACSPAQAKRILAYPGRLRHQIGGPAAIGDDRDPTRERDCAGELARQRHGGVAVPARDAAIGDQL